MKIEIPTAACIVFSCSPWDFLGPPTLYDPPQTELLGLFSQPIQFYRQLTNLPMEVISLPIKIAYLRFLSATFEHL